MGKPKNNGFLGIFFFFFSFSFKVRLTVLMWNFCAMFQVRCQGFIEVSQGIFTPDIKGVSTQVNQTGWEIRMGDIAWQSQVWERREGIIWASGKEGTSTQEPFGKPQRWVKESWEMVPLLWILRFEQEKKKWLVSSMLLYGYLGLNRKKKWLASSTLL